MCSLVTHFPFLFLFFIFIVYMHNLFHVLKGFFLVNFFLWIFICIFHEVTPFVSYLVFHMKIWGINFFKYPF